MLTNKKFQKFEIQHISYKIKDLASGVLSLMLCIYRFPEAQCRHDLRIRRFNEKVALAGGVKS